MKFLVPAESKAEVEGVLQEEKVAFSLGKDIPPQEGVCAFIEMEAQVLEVDVPTLYDQGPDVMLRAFRLPSGRVILATLDGGLVRIAQAPPGWERA